MSDDLLLAPGTRLLHIGLAKTGTSSLQSAFDLARPRLAAHGVRYAGRTRQVRSAAEAVVSGRAVAGLPASTRAEWPALVREVRRAHEHRVVVSSETFARADDAAARRVVEALGADRLHVVLTMRPLADLLASSWQQYVQSGERAAYDTWLRRVLGRDPKPITPSFWPRTRIDAVVARWAALVGAERLTVVSLADRPRDFVLRTFERLVGLPDGLLVPGPADANASLDHPTAEVLRRLNGLLRDDADWSRDLQARLVEFGAVRRLKAGDRDAPIRTPRWAREQAAVIAAEMNEGVRAAGVRVVGDLDALAAPGEGVEADRVEVPPLRPEGAAALVHAAMRAGRAEAARSGDLDGVGTAELVRLTAARLRDRLRTRLVRIRGSAVPPRRADGKRFPDGVSTGNC